VGQRSDEMNYEPNTRVWKPGDLVIHDCDAKRTDMLMRVIRYLPDGRCQTEYVDNKLAKRWGKGTRSKLLNRLDVLHDPNRFGLLWEPA
jgi:hypothetical protein